MAKGTKKAFRVSGNVADRKTRLAARDEPASTKKIRAEVKGSLATEAGVSLENVRLRAWIVTVEDPIGVELGHCVVPEKSADWSIPFEC